ncbi:MAG: phosphatidate cytidylyltransferase, partial [Planctomycetota bacterium]
MTVFFTAIVIFDGWLDGSLTAATADDKTIKATLLFILIALLIIPAQLEFTKLAEAKKLRIFTPVSIVASILFAGTWYWPQIIPISLTAYLLLLSVFVFLVLLLTQYIRYGTSDVIANCGANYLSIIYLGLLSSFCMAIRINLGLWSLLMFIFVVKCADIGAYAIGSMLGKN